MGPKASTARYTATATSKEKEGGPRAAASATFPGRLTDER
jgi:hypothetical protein